MGIAVRLEEEDGRRLKEVFDFKNVLHRVLPKPETAGFQWASTIDWYGDTVFNCAQAALLRKEWSILIANTNDSEDRDLLERIDKLLFECATGMHLYVKFYGD